MERDQISRRGEMGVGERKAKADREEECVEEEEGRKQIAAGKWKGNLKVIVSEERGKEIFRG